MEWTGFTDEDLRRLQKSTSSSGSAFIYYIGQWAMEHNSYHPNPNTDPLTECVTTHHSTGSS